MSEKRTNEWAYIIAAAIGVFCSQVLGMGWLFGLGVLFILGPVLNLLWNVLAKDRQTQSGTDGTARPRDEQDLPSLTVDRHVTHKDYACMGCSYIGPMLVKRHVRAFSWLFLSLSLLAGLIAALWIHESVVALIDHKRTLPIDIQVFVIVCFLAFLFCFLWLRRRSLTCPKCSGSRITHSARD
jgi:hypothetical protein